MNTEIEFVYKEEYWYISAFLNSDKISEEEITNRMDSLIKEILSSVNEEKIYSKKHKEFIFEMVQTISFKCDWVPYIDDLPYHDENTNLSYDTLGYFKFKVEYFKDELDKKKKIKPYFLQEIPYIIRNGINNAEKKLTDAVYLDLESPIYIFVTSNGTNPPDIMWTQEKIKEHKKSLAYWTVLYSGQWEDYSSKLYEERIKGNLSNRLSELHYINRNSGFVYMAEFNYENYFDAYMVGNVLEPTAHMRSIIFFLRSINESLDLIFLSTHSESVVNLVNLESKIKDLRYLRGIIQSTLSTIYDELIYNRRQHYTSVLNHLIKKFDLDTVKERVNSKFNLIYDTIQELYQKRNEENQERTEKALNILNFLLGAGILADLGGVLMIALSINEQNLVARVLHIVIAIAISGVLILAIIYYLYVKVQIQRENVKMAVDAVILDDKDNIVLIKRKFPPFKDFYALPGGAVDEGENPQVSLIREVKEETNLKVKIVKKIGIFDEPNRDPRGEVHSVAYLCKILGESTDLESGSDAKEAVYIPIKDLKNIDLAFDHEKIIEKALK